MTTPSRLSDPSARDGGANLADILERVLDKGVVIAGDIRINLLDIELLTIKLRLVVASVDKAKEMGIDWWERDPALSSKAGHAQLARENAELRARLSALEELEASTDRTPRRADRPPLPAEEPVEGRAEEPVEERAEKTGEGPRGGTG